MTTIEVNEKLKSILVDKSNKNNCSIDELLTNLVTKYYSDEEFDYQLISEAESYENKHGMKYYTAEELEKRHGINLTNFDDLDS